MYSHVQLTGLSTVKSLAAAPAGAVAVELQAHTQNIYYTKDGTDPSSTNGLILKADDKPTSFSGKFSDLKFLEVTASAVLNYSWRVDSTSA